MRGRQVIINIPAQNLGRPDGALRTSTVSAPHLWECRTDNGSICAGRRALLISIILARRARALVLISRTRPRGMEAVLRSRPGTGARSATIISKPQPLAMGPAARGARCRTTTSVLMPAVSSAARTACLRHRRAPPVVVCAHRSAQAAVITPRFHTCLRGRRISVGSAIISRNMQMQDTVRADPGTILNHQ